MNQWRIRAVAITAWVVVQKMRTKKLLKRLEHWCSAAITKHDLVIARWEELSSYARDCAVRIESADGSLEGVTRGLAPTGALMVELSNGETREIVSGEVSLRAAGASR